MMQTHQFLVGNPCGPCEWHIEDGIRTFCWFDVIFQAVFVVPVVLQLKVFLYDPPELKGPCDHELIEYAVAYSSLDIVNLGLGIISNILLYAASKIETRMITFRLGASAAFLLIAVIRQCLHGVGVILHVLRCDSSTWGYEIVVRLLCQYLLYGMWIVYEYMRWLQTGQRFVPRHGMMEPPTVALKAPRPSKLFPYPSKMSSSASWNESEAASGSMGSPMSGSSAFSSKNDIPAEKKNKKAAVAQPEVHMTDEEKAAVDAKKKNIRRSIKEMRKKLSMANGDHPVGRKKSADGPPHPGGRRKSVASTNDPPHLGGRRKSVASTNDPEPKEPKGKKKS